MKSRWICILLCLFVVRGFFCFYGFDRRPLVSSNDEVIIEDPALALARGQGLRLVSFPGLELTKMWAHYPPAFFLIQAAVYKVFGFSPASSRIPGICFSLLGVAILCGILVALFRTEYIDRFAMFASLLLLLFDPFIVVISRVGRMEQLALFFGLAGLAAVICATSPLRVSLWRWYCGAVLIGLSISTHPSAVLYWITFAALVFIARRELGIFKMALLLAIPAFAMAALWCAVYGDRSLIALDQMIRISRISVAPSLGMANFLQSIRARDIDMFKQAGGTAYVLLFAGWAALAVRAAIRPHSGPERWRSALWVFLIAGLFQMIAAWKFNLYVARTLLFVPLGILNLSIAIAWLPQIQRRVVAALAGAFAMVQLALFVNYFTRLTANRETWSPGRFDALVDSIPANATVLSTYQLWHTFMGRGREVAIIDTSLMPDRIFWENDISPVAR